jgi:hypothetical protein
MLHARIQSYSVFTAANWCRSVWGRRVWPWLASSESDCGSCCGIRLRDQIEYNEFCRRGQKQQKSSDACVGMPETRYGAKSHRPID